MPAASGRVVGFSICTPPGAKVVISEKAIRQSPGGAYKKYDGNEADHYPEWVDVLRLCSEEGCALAQSQPEGIGQQFASLRSTLCGMAQDFHDDFCKQGFSQVSAQNSNRPPPAPTKEYGYVADCRAALSGRSSSARA